VRILIGAGAVLYLLFVVACIRLAVLYTDDRGLSLGEGFFTLIGGLTLCAALFVPRHRALIVLAGTLPLVGWFVATPYNSGPPFLIASLVAPTLAGVAAVRTRL
jgi:hypothetical protein